MLIQEVISRIKEYHKGEGIKEATTRDKVLYGDIGVECTGIITTCWATTEVIEKAHSLGANLIICHEALFWNHGDHTKWLEETNNRVFLKKKELLDNVDYALSEYVRDSVMCGRDRTMLVTGHFNGEEPGMKYMTEYLQDALNEPIPCTYIQSGDMYHYYTKKGFV